MLNYKQHEETLLVLDVLLRLFFVINLRTYGHLMSHDCLAVKVSFISTRYSLSRKSHFNVLMFKNVKTALIKASVRFVFRNCLLDI